MVLVGIVIAGMIMKNACNRWSSDVKLPYCCNVDTDQINKQVNREEEK